MSEKINDRKYWKSLEHYFSKEKFISDSKNEFNDGVVSEFNLEETGKLSRRKFLALLGASAALAGTSCSDYRDKGEIIPYNNRPEGYLPGKSLFYASTCTGCYNKCSILVNAREGRPVKIDGNDIHPLNNGKICPTGQSLILNLYDPERLQEPTKEKRKISWNDATNFLLSKFQTISETDKEIALVINSDNSPSFNRLLSTFKQKYPLAEVYNYDLFLNDEHSFFDIDKAEVIVSIENDFLLKDGNFVRNSNLYGKSKDVLNTGKLSRLFVVEGALSLTGMNSDYRIRLRPDMHFEFLKHILNKIDSSAKVETKDNLENFLKEYRIKKEYFDLLISDLLEKESVILTSPNLTENENKIISLINSKIGADKFYSKLKYTQKENYSSLNDLLTKLTQNKIGILIHIDSNPVFDLPQNLNYKQNIRNVELVVSLSEEPNETTNLSNLVLPINNMLESWGYHHSVNKYLNFQQPIIAPIYNTRQKENVILSLINDGKYNDSDYLAYIKADFKKNYYDTNNFEFDFEKVWTAAIHDGFYELELNNDEIVSESDYNFENQVETKNIQYYIQIQKSSFIGNGKFANNGWLQEIPHPVSKITWDNYAAISPNTASELKLKDNDVIKIKTETGEVELPILIQPGASDSLISVELGYGRENCGSVAELVGHNVNSLINFSNNNFNYLIACSIEKTDKTYKLASTQEHHSLDDEFVKDFHYKRDIIQEGTLDEYKNDHHFLHKDKHEIFNITGTHEYKDVKWGMAIDLNKCTGCSACVTACNVENNIPVVGKEQVSVGREMHWIRIDRYYSGEPEEPKVSNQPMLCQHCDNAPCENVCPVNATNHSPDGLNQMVYNRCVGTRYCANNCPYKVRRFNFFDFRDHFNNSYYYSEVVDYVNNPEVTVRSRGVMEKCTFCVQRISEGSAKAIKDGVEFNGNGVTSACQDACPTDAIKFGNLNDKSSEVYKYTNSDLTYRVLELLNVRPNVNYIAKLRNVIKSEEV